MQLWTHHPSAYRIDAPDLKVYPKRGQYWKMRENRFRYHEMASRLWKLLGTDQLLWCCTVRGEFKRPTEDMDLVEWEINAPPSTILAYISSPVWEDLIWTRTDDWSGLILKHAPLLGNKDIHGLVTVPLPPGGVKCHGSPPPQFTREQEEQAWNILRNPPDPKLMEEYDFDSHE